LSWPIFNWAALISAVVVLVFYLSAYWFQAEAFRDDMSKQMRELNTKVTVITSRIESIINSPTIVRTRDLRDFCLLSERTNPGKFRCPDSYINPQTRKADRLRGTQITEGWRPEETQ
jgi:heme/copper-type cytochrome/quinol oxidase subunit 2